MDKIFGWFKHWQNSEWTPKGIAKKMAGVGVAAGVAVGAVSLGDTTTSTPAASTTMQPLLGMDATEGWLQRRLDGAKAWVKRHPAITGTVAGCAAGSVVPVVGTVIGCATGATVGYTIGSDEREGRMEDRATKP